MRPVSVTTPISDHGKSHLSKMLLHFLFAAFVDDDEHALLRFRKHDFVAAHVRRALRDLVQLDLDAGAGARGGFAGRAGQARRAHVLNPGDRAGGEQFEARFAHEFFHERIAHLHRAALLLGGFLGQILRRERRARQTVAARGRADVKHRVANAFGRAARDLFVTQHAEAEGVHERIAFVGFVEIDLARDGRDAEAIAVMRDARHDAGEQTLVICDLRFAICDFRVSAFGESWLALTPALSPGERETSCGRRW